MSVSVCFITAKWIYARWKFSIHLNESNEIKNKKDFANPVLDSRNFRMQRKNLNLEHIFFKKKN